MELERELEQIKDSINASFSEGVTSEEAVHLGIWASERASDEPFESAPAAVTTSTFFRAQQLGDVSLTAEAVAEIIDWYETTKTGFFVVC